MKKLFLFGLAAFLTVSLSSFSDQKRAPLAALAHAGPAGDYITTFTVDHGPYAGTYEAYADKDDHSILLAVRGSSGWVAITPIGIGIWADEYNNMGGYSFTFDSDSSQLSYGFVYYYP